jgi:hypothetical protein
MRDLKEDIELHRWSVVRFLAFWAIVCVLTVVTIDRNRGQAGGTTLVALSLLLPFVAGVTASTWRTSPAIIGAFVSAVNMAFSVGCQWWADKAGGSTGPTNLATARDALAELPLLAVLYVVIGLAFSYLGAAMTRATRHS